MDNLKSSAYRLHCGCIPDASGYGYCPECELKLKEKIWRQMSHEKRQYDRHFAPAQSAVLDKSIRYGEPSGCSCHINPPCSYCTNKTDEDE